MIVAMMNRSGCPEQYVEAVDSYLCKELHVAAPSGIHAVVFSLERRDVRSCARGKSCRDPSDVTEMRCRAANATPAPPYHR